MISKEALEAMSWDDKESWFRQNGRKVSFEEVRWAAGVISTLMRSLGEEDKDAADFMNHILKGFKKSDMSMIEVEFEDGNAVNHYFMLTMEN